MPPTENSTATGELDAGGVEALRTVQGATALIDKAIANGIAAQQVDPVGDHGLAVLVPEGYKVETVDVRQFEDEPRLATYRQGVHKFVGVDSLGRYVGRYKTDDSIAYIRDVYGRGNSMLTSDTDVATVQLDDHPANPDSPVGRRAHLAVLVLRPTAAAKRWGAAFGQAIDQESFLDLVVDGIGEIASPDGAQLRDLIGDLHAIRQTEVKAVIRTGGEGAIQLNENVKLHAGPGDQVTFPEEMRLVLQPFAGISDTIMLDVRIAPKVRADHVMFVLTCPTLDDKLAALVGSVSGDITDQTGLACHWQP